VTARLRPSVLASLGLASVVVGAAALAAFTEPAVVPAAQIIEAVPAPPMVATLNGPPAVALDPIAVPAAASAPTPVAVPVVDLAICLDTSGSMDGLLDSARARIWDIVNSATRRYPGAQVRVALLTYGSPGGASAAEGYVLQHSDLSQDLDSVYARMMSLGTAGGDEYVGWVMHDAVEDLEWSQAAGAVHLLVVAGNEEADQGALFHDFRTVGAKARERGIKVSAIYAGNHDQGVHHGWDQVARAGGGTYVAIDMAAGLVQVDTPYDAELGALNGKLNGTYVPYGSGGAGGLQQMLNMDAGSSGLGARTMGSRIGTKGSSSFKNESWDLVDAVKDGKVKLEDVPEAALPSELAGRDQAGREAWLRERGDERKAVQTKIQALQAERARYLEKQRAAEEGNSLDAAIDEVLSAPIEGK
jgi:von Willebrand factor type A domain